MGTGPRTRGAAAPGPLAVTDRPRRALQEPDRASYPTDLWSLGVSLFELATGALPFPADSDLLFGVAVAAPSPPLPSLLLPDSPGASRGGARRSGGGAG
jgi:serine/threonine protein kinase